MSKNEEILFIKFFGNRLKEIRLKNNLSQENLANDANIPINQVGRIERAEIFTSLRTVFKLSKALNIEVIEFFIDSDAITIKEIVEK